MKFLIVIYVRTACQNYWTIIAIGRVLGCSAAKRSKITAQLWATIRLMNDQLIAQLDWPIAQIAETRISNIHDNAIFRPPDCINT